MSSMLLGETTNEEEMIKIGGNNIFYLFSYLLSLYELVKYSRYSLASKILVEERYSLKPIYKRP